MHRVFGWVAAVSAVGVLLHAVPAEACGCFAPPSVTEPVVQAGERILFAVDNGKVIAHIQIQYSGQAKDFGWLVPLPAVPVVKVGTNELFSALSSVTSPSYTVQQTFSGAGCRSQPSLSLGCGAASPSAISTGGETIDRVEPFKPSPVVVRDVVGAFEYVVLKADDRTEMFKWLSDNRFYVPTGTQDAVGPYVRPGAFFLALKLKASASVGDITPIVLEYPAELPMIPLILTSVGATPNMGVQVWVVGTGRAIPRNFHHVVPNEAALDRASPEGYGTWLREAIASAPNKHAFVTEYAGPSSIMSGTVAPTARFGSEEMLAAQATPGAFVDVLNRTGFIDTSTNQLPVVVREELLKAFPFPSGLEAKGVTVDTFLGALDYYLDTHRTQHPEDFGANYTVTFEPVSLAHAIFEKHVKPMRDLQELFTRFPKLTRLVTILSPEDMTKDPVFSFSSTLPDVVKDHLSFSDVSCVGTMMTTDQGIHYPTNRLGAPLVKSAAALRIETLSEEGAPTVLTDNKELIQRTLTPNEAASAPPAPMAGGCSAVIDPALLGLAALLRSLRRRKS